MQVKKLKPHFDQAFPKVKWNFDLADADKILRIDSEEDIVTSITDFLQNLHYHCEELN